MGVESAHALSGACARLVIRLRDDELINQCSLPRFLDEWQELRRRTVFVYITVSEEQAANARRIFSQEKLCR